MTTVGSVFPITIPVLTDTADIQVAFTKYHYGDASSTANAATLLSTPNSVAGYLQNLTTYKADLLNPIFTSGNSTPASISFQNTAADHKIKLTVPGTFTSDKTVTIPAVNANDTLVALNETQTFTNKTFSLSTNTLVASIAQINSALTDSSNKFATLSGSEILTNKTLTTPVISSIVNSGSTIILPSSTDTLVGRNTTDTLTNKTLTLPSISSISNGGTITLPTTTDTLIGRSTTDTLINKTLTSPIISSPIISGTVTLSAASEKSVVIDATTGKLSFTGDVDFGGAVNISSAGASLSVPNGSITELKISDGAVTTNKIADGAITTSKNADASITYAKLASDATASATSLLNGMVRIGSDLPQAATVANISSVGGRTYLTQFNDAKQLVVNIPWTDTVYSLPPASPSTLGGIKVGANLTISNGILSGAAPFTLTAATASTLGGIIVDNSSIQIALDGTISIKDAGITTGMLSNISSLSTLKTVNGTTIPSSKELVTTVSTTKIAAGTSGKADTAGTSDVAINIATPSSTAANFKTNANTTVSYVGTTAAIVGKIFVQSATPSSTVSNTGDLWFW